MHLYYLLITDVASYVEHHPYLVQKDLIDLANVEGITVIGYSSFGPLSFCELQWQRAMDTPTLFTQDVITTIAKRHQKTPAQVLLRWATQRGIAIIPKASSQGRLLENLDAFSFNMTEDELNTISSLDGNIRFNNPVDYLGTLRIFA